MSSQGPYERESLGYEEVLGCCFEDRRGHEPGPQAPVAAAEGRTGVSPGAPSRRQPRGPEFGPMRLVGLLAPKT